MTVSAWVKPSSLNGWTTVVLKERPGGLAYALYASDNTAKPPAGYVNTGGGDLKASKNPVLPLNVWTHLAVTYDGQSLRLYVNGLLRHSRSASGSIRTSASPLRIGGNAVWGEYFKGLIDEVRIYGRALSLAEIQTDRNRAISAACQ
jgi:hypothetical protein